MRQDRVSGATTGVSFRGLTLRNACSPTSGGGIRVANGGRCVTIDSCTITNCHARFLSGNSYGGGVFFAGSTCSISNSVIRGNSGIFNFDTTDMRLFACVITNQPAIGSYSGMGTAYMGLSMRNCLYAYNYQPLVLQWCHLENCTVVSNYNNGIALTTGRSSTVQIRNCVSYGNRYKSYASNVNGANSTGDFFYTKDWAKRTDITLMVTNSYIANGAAVLVQ